MMEKPQDKTLYLSTQESSMPSKLSIKPRDLKDFTKASIFRYFAKVAPWLSSSGSTLYSIQLRGHESYL